MSTPLTMTDEALRRVADDDLRIMRDMLQESVSDGGPLTADWRRLLGRVQSELGRRYAVESPAPQLRLVQD